MAWVGLRSISRRTFSTAADRRHYFPSDFPTADFTLVGQEELLRFCSDCLLSSGAKPKHADCVARVLVEADLRAVYSHGINRLKMYADECRTGAVDVEAEPVVERERAGTAVVSGRNALGAVCGEFSMSLAIEKAKTHGIGWVLARNSNHYGIAGHYAMMALDHGLIGMSMTNTSPLVVPTRAKNPALGTNPIALAAPTSGRDPFVLDMATSAVALGKVEVAHRRGDKLPLGWSVGPSGLPTDDAEAAVHSSVTGKGGLMPLGGLEENGGYKGYGLAMLVEVLGGVLADSSFGREVRTWQSPLLEGEGADEGANLGQTFVAIDPDFFMPGFPQRMDRFVDQMRGLPSAEGQPAVMVPGEPELNARREQSEHGIRLHDSLVESLHRLAEECGVPRVGLL